VANLEQKRILFVHAHPDDETLNSGATIAKCVAEGAQVTVLICTAGEEGSVVDIEMQRLQLNENGYLAEIRLKEFRKAMKELGVRDHRLLGNNEIRWRDSGILAKKGNSESFANADVEVAGSELAKIIRETRPQVVVTYDSNGGYGHPDHVKTHFVTMRAVELASRKSFKDREPWVVKKIYFYAFPRSLFLANIRKINQKFKNLINFESLTGLSFLIDDSFVTTAIDGSLYAGKKIEALKAYRSQIVSSNPLFDSTDREIREIWGTEYFTLQNRSDKPQIRNDELEHDFWQDV
jgi:N-acetyl-1-D-myo-inositol-2-amino-2-deoxy-alpha-D-glucopyranoside deacetylase